MFNVPVTAKKLNPDPPTQRGPTMQYEPFTKITLTVGILAEREVTAITMPHRAFVQLVKDELETFRGNGGLRESGSRRERLSDRRCQELLAVAQRMVRFPLSTWVHKTRGCGCLVGEWLIAHDVMTRAGVNEDFVSVEYRILEQSDGASLMSFGCNIDRAVKAVIGPFCYEYQAPHAVVVVFTDDDGYLLDQKAMS
jgi:hypothetical protein